MTVALNPKRHKRITQLRDLRLKRAMIALNDACAAEAQAASRLKLAKATLDGRRAIRARSHRRLYKAMLASGVNARGLEALDAAFEPHDTGITRAENAVDQGTKTLNAAQQDCRKAAEDVQLRQKECDVWAQALCLPNKIFQKSANRSEDHAQDELTQMSTWGDKW